MARFSILYPLVLALTLIATGSAGMADEKWDDETRMLERAESQSELLPLAELLRRLAIDPAELLEVEVEEEDDRLVYEIYYLSKDGRRHEIVVDAASGDLIENKEHD